MLQRSMKVVSSGAVPVSGSPVVGTSLPRVLTIRSPAQVGSGGTIISGVPGVTTMRPGTIILSSAGNISQLGSAAFPTSEEIDNSVVLGPNAEGVQAPGLLATHSGYYDLTTGLPAPGAMPGYLQPGSPSGRDSGDEQEHMPTGLKTNGLRRYARCVCNKVKEKGVTSYSEVADELVHEYAAEHPMIPSEQLHYIQKNIRRRVYDALNVLMALNVLQKEKKEIRWVGLPVNMIEECRRLEEEREKRQVSLRNKLMARLFTINSEVLRARQSATKQFSNSPPSDSHSAIPIRVPRFIKIDPPSEAEIRNVIQARRGTPEEQAGFRAGRGCIDQIGSHRPTAARAPSSQPKTKSHCILRLPCNFRICR
ncbi:unnamed protein product [Echinostoma caproni]|uniref:E2F_TDP domain-containing protein n=1 Tax=Echinostoma caproni TaxID=27848 RepID=A0A183B2V0_9TREM|nr:unnamed protein product [Echinostoma caproni]